MALAKLLEIVPCFFFSSRRRHTRLVSDWSSDVCSSDLLHRRLSRRDGSRIQPPAGFCARSADRPRRLLRLQRSEERRVGKECRSRWSPEHEKKKRTTQGRARLRRINRTSTHVSYNTRNA